jgi:hypothetical protein
MSRPEEPENLKLWKRAIEALGDKPKCCHTCDHYSGDGTCEIAGSRPPDDYVRLHSFTCKDYSKVIPF